MKQQDIAIIVVVVVVVGVASYFLSSKFITPSSQNRTAHTVQPISSEFPVPSEKVFNTEAINPTVKIQISPSENGQPFSNSQQ